jgi:plastocyanin
MRLLAAALSALALGLAACGGDDEGPAQPASTAPADTAPADAAPAAKGGVVEIDMNDQLQFVPKQATVKVGQTVRWVNTGQIPHNTVADDGQWKSDIFSGGGSFEYEPTEAGTLRYVCTLHPGMDGTLQVTE